MQDPTGGFPQNPNQVEVSTLPENGHVIMNGGSMLFQQGPGGGLEEPQRPSSSQQQQMSNGNPSTKPPPDVYQIADRSRSSKYRGVCWNKKNKRWQAAINVSGTYIYLGSFIQEEAAAKAFDKAAIEHRGKRAKVNFAESKQMYMAGQGIPSSGPPGAPMVGGPPQRAGPTTLKREDPDGSRGGQAPAKRSRGGPVGQSWGAEGAGQYPYPGPQGNGVQQYPGGQYTYAQGGHSGGPGDAQGQFQFPQLEQQHPGPLGARGGGAAGASGGHTATLVLGRDIQGQILQQTLSGQLGGVMLPQKSSGFSIPIQLIMNQQPGGATGQLLLAPSGITGEGSGGLQQLLSLGLIQGSGLGGEANGGSQGQLPSLNTDMLASLFSPSSAQLDPGTGQPLSQAANVPPPSMQQGQGEPLPHFEDVVATVKGEQQEMSVPGNNTPPPSLEDVYAGLSGGPPAPQAPQQHPHQSAGPPRGARVHKQILAMNNKYEEEYGLQGVVFVDRDSGWYGFCVLDSEEMLRQELNDATLQAAQHKCGIALEQLVKVKRKMAGINTPQNTAQPPRSHATPPTYTPAHPQSHAHHHGLTHVHPHHSAHPAHPSSHPPHQAHPSSHAPHQPHLSPHPGHQPHPSPTPIAHPPPQRTYPSPSPTHPHVYSSPPTQPPPPLAFIQPSAAAPPPTLPPNPSSTPSPSAPMLSLMDIYSQFEPRSNAENGPRTTAPQSTVNKLDSKISSLKLSALESILKGSGSFPIDDGALRSFRTEYQRSMAEQAAAAAAHPVENADMVNRGVDLQGSVSLASDVLHGIPALRQDEQDGNGAKEGEHQGENGTELIPNLHMQMSAQVGEGPGMGAEGRGEVGGAGSGGL